MMSEKGLLQQYMPKADILRCGRDWRYSITCRRGRAMFLEYSA
jgi:hypothetical protein